VPPTVPDYAGANAYSSASAYYCIKDTAVGSELVKRGSVGRTPWLHTLDMQVAYIPQWANKKLTLQVDVFNIFNAQKATELNEVRDYSRAESNSTTAPYRVSQNYLLPTSFQDGRSVRLTARYEF
jgi:TonB dependent receptor